MDDQKASVCFTSKASGGLPEFRFDLTRTHDGIMRVSLGCGPPMRDTEYTIPSNESERLLAALRNGTFVEGEPIHVQIVGQAATPKETLEIRQAEGECEVYINDEFICATDPLHLKVFADQPTTEAHTAFEIDEYGNRRYHFFLGEEEVIYVNLDMRGQAVWRVLDCNYSGHESIDRFHSFIKRAREKGELKSPTGKTRSLSEEDMGHLTEWAGEYGDGRLLSYWRLSLGLLKENELWSPNRDFKITVDESGIVRLLSPGRTRLDLPLSVVKKYVLERTDHTFHETEVGAAHATLRMSAHTDDMGRRFTRFETSSGRTFQIFQTALLDLLDAPRPSRQSRTVLRGGEVHSRWVSRMLSDTKGLTIDYSESRFRHPRLLVFANNEMITCGTDQLNDLIQNISNSDLPGRIQLFNDRDTCYKFDKEEGRSLLDWASRIQQSRTRAQEVDISR